MSETQYPVPRPVTSPVPATPVFPAVLTTTAPATTTPPPTFAAPVQAHLAAPSRVVGKTRHLWAVWLLQFTLIYPLIWYFKVNKELRDFDPDIDVQPGLAVLAVTFGAILLAIPPIVSYTHTTSRIQKAQKLAGSKARCSVLLAWLCGFLTLGMVYVQSQTNKIWAQYGNPPARTPIASPGRY
ncbi:MAG TPA: DUF4234 domain-containing protein [Acidimicrobiales bacterium]|nr:DUF4234 domain-containing protein [Acidimicrobiales bacterium]